MRFFRDANEIRRTRPDLLFTMALWTAYFVLHLTGERVVGPIAWWATTLVLGFLFLLTLFLAVLLFSRLPVPHDASAPTRINRGVAIGAVVAVAASGLLALSALAHVAGHGCSSVQGVFLIVALAALVDGFLRQPERVHLMSDLETLRRALMYDRLEPTEGRRRLRVLVRGADLSDLVCAEAMACLASIDRAVAKARTCVERLCALEAVVGRASGPLDSAEQAVAQAVLQEQQSLLEAASAARGAAAQDYGRIRSRWAQLGRLSQAELDLAAAMEQLLISRDRVIDEVEAERRAAADRVLLLLQKREPRKPHLPPGA